MEEDKAHELFNKYRKGETSAEENGLIESWYLNEISKSDPLDQQIDYDFSGERIWAKIQQQRPVKKIRFRLPVRISAAAAVLLIVGSGLFFYLNHKSPVPESTFANDVQPGRNGATLTLANGRKIKLDDAMNGELAKEAGVAITKTADGQLRYEIQNSNGETNAINTISTAKGESYQLRLPDGTLVWLNAGSSLTYTAALNDHGLRKVKLNGEGYFQVAKDKAHPFIVETFNQEIEVLGTHFNVSAYHDEPLIKTTLLEGMVRLNKNEVLKPGEQAINNLGKISVEKVDVTEAVAWKNGKFVFNDESLESIMRKLSRWYDLTIIFKDQNMRNQKFWATITRQDKLSRILQSLEKTNMVKFQLQQRTVTISNPDH
ncbi:FecR domain-containing protein [Pedobacter sp. FW305-3-2-15-E-R2A2]|uniref:FecR family protein n=2 Tax=Pedobacter sp. FW305-3-2-15-E-R2A2 TaxID=3140251 RepID=UPI003140BBD4